MIDRLNVALEGRYRIERELGEGGMATVYLAEDLRHRRKVAVKVLRPELAAVVGAERFLAEIETTANLQHPYILPLFDSGEADGFLFYVMPYVEGESLREKLDREKQLRVDEAVEIARKVADALDYAHEQGVVHRDVKPANILLSARGEPLVADFGIARAVSQAGGGTAHRDGAEPGDASLHVARAGDRGPGRGSPLRRLRPRLRALRAAGR
jgi:eukaryotic-like serine/threonine-protein kinase